ncbi:predicted protein [Nematostella vectensis]|uniref:Uncharacterized protein n=1 Tax=Nematostella vectensis TaxID=45351 RepID=A7STQ3_NEMVE|nr:predicted protein [Nematostella vectensis]|eukprot:XP_001625019.1 predicted protein [Nematostella vectensis]
MQKSMGRKRPGSCQSKGYLSQEQPRLNSQVHSKDGASSKWTMNSNIDLNQNKVMTSSVYLPSLKVPLVCLLPSDMPVNAQKQLCALLRSKSAAATAKYENLNNICNTEKNILGTKTQELLQPPTQDVGMDCDSLLNSYTSPKSSGSVENPKKTSVPTLDEELRVPPTPPPEDGSAIMGEDSTEPDCKSQSDGSLIGSPSFLPLLSNETSPIWCLQQPVVVLKSISPSLDYFSKPDTSLLLETEKQARAEGHYPVVNKYLSSPQCSVIEEPSKVTKENMLPSQASQEASDRAREKGLVLYKPLGEATTPVYRSIRNCHLTGSSEMPRRQGDETNSAVLPTVRRTLISTNEIEMACPLESSDRRLQLENGTTCSWPKPLDLQTSEIPPESSVHQAQGGSANTYSPPRQNSMSSVSVVACKRLDDLPLETSDTSGTSHDKDSNLSITLSSASNLLVTLERTEDLDQLETACSPSMSESSASTNSVCHTSTAAKPNEARIPCSSPDISASRHPLSPVSKLVVVCERLLVAQQGQKGIPRPSPAKSTGVSCFPPKHDRSILRPPMSPTSKLIVACERLKGLPYVNEKMRASIEEFLRKYNLSRRTESKGYAGNLEEYDKNTKSYNVLERTGHTCIPPSRSNIDQMMAEHNYASSGTKRISPLLDAKVTFERLSLNNLNILTVSDSYMSLLKKKALKAARMKTYRRRKTIEQNRKRKASVAEDDHQSKRRKLSKSKKEKGEMEKRPKKARIPIHYRNYQPWQIKTIPTLKMRYKVSFALWPERYSNALARINQRLTNQNSFWNSIR